MSPNLLATLRRIESETRRLATTAVRDGASIPDRARYPRDYYRPAELLRRFPRPGSVLLRHGVRLLTSALDATMQPCFTCTMKTPTTTEIRRPRPIEPRTW